jgi:hypothetical protein
VPGQTLKSKIFLIFCCEKYFWVESFLLWKW